MPIRRETRALYPKNWKAISASVRFNWARGSCEACGRPHLTLVAVLPDGRWFDQAAGSWRDARGRQARFPTLLEAIDISHTRVVLAAAHLDANPRNNRRRNLRALCQRCHLQHDRPWHRFQRWLTIRRRSAVGDLFLGSYDVPQRGRSAVMRQAPPLRLVEMQRLLTQNVRLPLLAWQSGGRFS